MEINHLEFGTIEMWIIIKTPSLGKGAAGCEMAGRGLTQLLNPSLRPPKGGNPTTHRLISNLSNTHKLKFRNHDQLF